MQLLQHEQVWALARARQEEMIREAAQAHMANMAQGQQPSLWRRILQRSVEQPTVVSPEVAPELG